MKLIALTLQDGRSVYFNTQHLISFSEIPKNARTPFGTFPKERKGSMIYHIGDADCLDVIETPEQIIELIKKL